MTGKTPGEAKRRWVKVSLAVLAVLLPTSAIAIVLVWAPQMPSPVAIHWGFTGQPDRFVRFAPALVELAAIAMVPVLVALGLAFGVSNRGGATRPLIALALYFSGFGSGLILYTFGIQRGLSDAAEADMSGGIVLAVVLAPVVLAAAAMVIMRPGPIPAPTVMTPSDAPIVGLVGGKVPVWRGHTSSSTGLIVFAALLGLVPIVILAALLKSVWLGLLAVLFVVFAYGMLAFNVTVDGQGLLVESQIGWPRKFIPADKIVSASVVAVHPFQDFGGWGWRMSLSGETGVVMRKGPGIAVVYGDEETLVVTLDEGAEVAAATVNTAAMVARSEGS